MVEAATDASYNLCLTSYVRARSLARILTVQRQHLSEHCKRKKRAESLQGPANVAISGEVFFSNGSLAQNSLLTPGKLSLCVVRICVSSAVLAHTLEQQSCKPALHIRFRQ